jgi:probable HAF family extracellular repeat protein
MQKILASIILLITLHSLAEAQPSYTVTDLGDLFTPTSINNLGEVGGYSQTGTTIHAFLYRNGKMIDIGAGSGSTLWELNDRGEAIGTAGDPNRYYFLYSGGAVHRLTAPNSDVVFTNLNNSGELIGYTAEPTADLGFRYLNGHSQSLGTLGKDGCAPLGINNQGQIVGQSGAVFAGHAFLYDNGRMHDLGALGANSAHNSSFAYAVNDLGQVVGFGYLPIPTGSVAHAFFYSAGVMRDIGTLPGYTGSVAVGINNSGQIVGYCYSASSSAPFVYENGHMYNLSALLSASAINDFGQIVGQGTDGHALVLTPRGRGLN